MEEARKPFLVVAYDHIGERQAGPAIRTLALASELASCGQVDVLHEGEGTETANPALRFLKRDEVTLDSRFFEGYRGALVPPMVALTLPEILTSNLPLAVDLFDPVVWENLELYADKTEPERVFQHERHLAALLAAIFRGDYFLAAGYRQLDLVMGALMVANRLNPLTWRRREGIQQIVGLVPFGLPNEQPPSKDELALPEELKGREPLVVWGGGMWDWLEPEIVVRCWPEVLRRYPSATLVFPGTEHPNPHVPVMAAVGRVRKTANELGVADSIFYGKWFPRQEYLGLLAHAACGVSAHSPGLESRYAARTRYLDAIWIGLPMVVSEGDEYAEYIAVHKLGVVVRESNPSDFASGILRVLDTGKAYMADNFSRARQRLTWKRMAAPLVEWAASPRLTHGPGADFFRDVAGRASPRARPADPLSLVRRILSRIKKG